MNDEAMELLFRTLGQILNNQNRIMNQTKTDGEMLTIQLNLKTKCLIFQQSMSIKE